MLFRSVLTALPLHELQELLQGVFGRTVVSYVSIWSAAEKPYRGLRFAHDTLRETANERLGARTLADARRQITGWADLYREQGWPPLTPPYLLREYFPWWAPAATANASPTWPSTGPATS